MSLDPSQFGLTTLSKTRNGSAEPTGEDGGRRKRVYDLAFRLHLPGLLRRAQGIKYTQEATSKFPDNKSCLNI